MASVKQEGLIEELCAELCISIQTAIDSAGVRSLLPGGSGTGIDGLAWRVPKNVGELDVQDASAVIDWLLAEKRA